MGARLFTYYQKLTSADQNAATLRNGSKCVGTVVAVEPTDKSPFLGDIKPGYSQSSLETNMYRAPVFPHKVASTDYLLVRSAKGKISLRRIDHIHVVGQQVCQCLLFPTTFILDISYYFDWDCFDLLGLRSSDSYYAF